jgi:large subunit ribosomal protein L13
MKITQTNQTNKEARASYLIDADKLVLGRLATKIASLLIGKHKVTFDPSRDMGDIVIVTNVDKIRVTGNKLENKSYYRHSGFPGGIKETRLKDLIVDKPEELLRSTVLRMLPRNKLKINRIKRLKSFRGPDSYKKQLTMPVQEIKI